MALNPAVRWLNDARSTSGGDWHRLPGADPLSRIGALVLPPLVRRCGDRRLPDRRFKKQPVGFQVASGPASLGLGATWTRYTRNWPSPARGGAGPLLVRREHHRQTLLLLTFFLLKDGDRLSGRAELIPQTTSLLRHAGGIGPRCLEHHRHRYQRDRGRPGGTSSWWFSACPALRWRLWWRYLTLIHRRRALERSS